jgi:O-antigen/teichoic acid export membrane protein
MLNLICTKFNSDFVKNSFTIFSGNVIAQAIPFLCEPILTRIYSPKDFAVLAVYLSVANLFSIIATARYEMAIMLPKEDRKAINVLGLSLIISLIVSAFSFIIVWVFNLHICKILNNDDVAGYLYLVPLSVLSVSWYQVFNYWNSRKKRFQNVAISKSVQSITTISGNIGLAFLKSLGLILGQIIGFLFGVATLCYSFLRRDNNQLKTITQSEMKEMAIVHQDFPKVNSVQAFGDVLKQSAEIFLLSFYYLKEQVGLYSRTLRLLFAPSAMIGSAVGQVFYQKASETYLKTGNIRQLTLKVLITLACISLPFFLIVALWGDSLFAWFLGEDYRIAGVYGKYLVPYLFFSFITSPVSQIPLIVNKQKKALLLSWVGHTAYLSAIILGGIYGNILLGFTFLSIFASLYYIGLITWLLKISKS